MVWLNVSIIGQDWHKVNTGALNGQFEIFALQKIRFCSHMGWCGNHLPTLEQFNVYSEPGLWVSNGANDASQTTALNGKGYIFRCGGGWHQHVGHWWINFIRNYWVGKLPLWKLRGACSTPPPPWIRPWYLLACKISRYCFLALRGKSYMVTQQTEGYPSATLAQH